jgi:hypothetical protein
MDDTVIVDPGANAEAIFQAEGQKKPVSTDKTCNPHGRPLRNFN